MLVSHHLWLHLLTDPQVVKGEERGHNAMANQEQLDILKQGVETWNKWRVGHPDVQRPNLSSADLSNAHLSNAHLSGAGLGGADLGGADLSGANLSGADLSDADLSEADLSKANLFNADLRRADLRRANLFNAKVLLTTFGNVDLSVVKGLDTIRHDGPSTIGIDTIYLSQG